MKTYIITYRCETDIHGDRIDRVHRRGYDADHACERFADDDDDDGGWVILDVRLAPKRRK